DLPSAAKEVAAAAAGCSGSPPAGCSLCEAVLQVLIVGLVVATFPFSLAAVPEGGGPVRAGVIFRLGRIRSSEASGPGMIFLLPGIDSMKLVDLRTMTFDVPTQEVLTKDSVTVAVEAVVYYRIFDPVMSVVNVEDCSRSTKLLAQTTLRNVLGTASLYQLLAGRDESTLLMQETLDAATDTWGVKVERRAMAAEAEAAREARAKVIAAEGEQKASKALKAAAIELSECVESPLQLRYLQTLCSISAEKNSTIIFPLPIEMLQMFQTEQQQPPPQSTDDSDATAPTSCARPVITTSRKSTTHPQTQQQMGAASASQVRPTHSPLELFIDNLLTKELAETYAADQDVPRQLTRPVPNKMTRVEEALQKEKN
uniref:PHB domain-containing protein n=1 Tax=Macrostomum lignano TaxID=282301 RepID=A0A1I8FKR9_9PLAT